jgi:maltooligosyltrehalose trehalohydrolase
LEDKKILYFVNRSGDDVIFCIFCFHDEPQAFPLSLPGGEWDRILDTSDPAWGGDGGRTVLRIKLEGVPVTLSINPFSAVLYRKASGA